MTLSLPECLRLAVDASRDAAQALTAQGVSGRRVLRELPRDVKIEADTIAEELIGARLRKHTDWPILSEERVPRELSQPVEGLWWIVDPLDGTMNFSRGIPWSAVSIGLWQGLTPLAGVVQDLAHGECFSGIVGQGAWLNGEPIRVSNAVTRASAILCTGVPASRDFSSEALGRVVQEIQAFRKVRWLGSAALSLAYVSCGRADAYAEQDISLWDVAAGMALVEAASGTTHMNRPDEGWHVSVMAGNRWLVGEYVKDMGTVTGKRTTACRSSI